MKYTGFALLLTGIVLTLFTTFQFFTTETIIEIGSLEITRDKPHYLKWSPLLGILVMGIGGLVLWKSNKK